MKKIVLFILISILTIATYGQNQARKTAESYNKRGTYLMSKQMYAEAIVAFTHAIETDNTYGDAYFNRATAIQKSNLTFETFSYCSDLKKAADLGNLNAKKAKEKANCN